jgi:hypothetical protein
VYDPYTDDEFSEWLLDLRRGEIIMFGSFPFTFFFATEGYDLFRLSTHNFDSAYAPWPLKDPVKGPYSFEEQVGVVIAAVSLSLVIAVVDYIVRKSSEELVLNTGSNENANGQDAAESEKENNVSIPSETQEQGNQ